MLNEQAQALASTDGAAGGHDVALLQKIDETSDAVCTINQEVRSFYVFFDFCSHERFQILRRGTIGCVYV